MPDAKLMIDPKTTALVLIDLQKGITGQSVAPHSAQEVVANCARLADRFRLLGALVVLVHVSLTRDGGDRLTALVDAQGWSTGTRPPDWDELVPAIGPREGDLVVTKRQWGAFYGTDLDLQLRRRGIATIVLGGISTNFGVESTARSAYEHNYAVIFAEDAMASMTAEAHSFAMTTIFPRLGRIRSTAQVLTALDTGK
jgi:nicotinamidase-related amidase